MPTRPLPRPPQIIILSDPYQLDTVRYMGPYTIKNHLTRAGYDVVVIDYFTRFESDQEFFDYLANFVSDRLISVMISTTFTYSSPTEAVGWARSEVSSHVKSDQEQRTGWWEHVKASSLFLWKGTNGKLRHWMESLKSTLADNHASHAKIVLGGERLNWIFKFNPEQIPEDYALGLTDYCLLGKADNYVVDFVQGLETGKFGSINFSMTKKSGMTFLVPQGRQIYDRHRDEIPDSTFSVLDAVLPGEWLPFENARGCAFNCSYCNYDKGYSQKKSIEQMRREFMYNWETHGTTGYSFTGECFNDDYAHVCDFLELVESLPFRLEWNGYARLDLSHKYPDLANKVIDSGGRSLIFGIETLSRPAGSINGRGLKPQRVLELAEQYKKAGDKYGGVHLKACFISGLPGETPESQTKTNDWIRKQTIFNSVLGNVLEVMPYEEDLESVFNFSRINLDPSKYGFRELSFDPYYWRHDTMDVDQAVDLNWEFNEANRANPYTFKYGNGKRNVNLYFYSAARSLGMSHPEAMQVFHSVTDLYPRFRKRIKKYHSRLLALWTGKRDK